MIILYLMAVYVLAVTFVNWRRPKNFPPGPLSLPIIGGLYRLGKDPFAASIKMWREYGPLVGIDVASYRSIIINDHKTLKAAMSNPALQGRPDMTAFRTKFRVKDGRLAGIVVSEGTPFLENHRFALKTLKQFGFETKRMETAILEEVDKILDFFDRKGPHGISSKNLFNPYTANVIWSLMSSRKFPNERQLAETIKAFEEFKEALGVAPIAMLFPWLIKWIPGLIGWTKYFDACERYTKIFDSCVASHKRDKFDLKKGDQDFVDVYLEEIGKCQDPGSIFYGEFGEFNLSAILSDLMAGGVDTVSEALTWSLAILINFPEVQKRVQDEIDEVIGSSDRITLEHRPRLVYLTAFLKEVMRFRPPVPWAVPHKAMEDTKIGQFDVPKGTTIYPNIFAICQDPSLWEKPDQFCPERFLSSDGQNVISMEEFTFGKGRRMCPGNFLALEEMMLIMANILRRYDISNDPRRQFPPSLKHIPLLVMTPPPFEFMAHRRCAG